jgi:alanine racemase
MRHNLVRARTEARGRFVWAVVKANAYGHGLLRAMRAFEAADGLALLDLDEARRARDAGWRKPILLLEGAFEASDLAVCSDLDLTTVVHCGEQLEMLERSARAAALSRAPQAQHGHEPARLHAGRRRGQRTNDCKASPRWAS